MPMNCHRPSGRTRITLYAVLLLSLAGYRAAAGTTGSKPADSLHRIALRDSLVRTVEENKRQYDHTADTGGRKDFAVPAYRFFDADVSAPSEAMNAAPLCLPVSFGLSNRFNRYLGYGNTAPVSQVFENGDLLFTSFDATKGTDDVFMTEASAVSMLPANRFSYTPVAGSAVPEGLFYWENGVFKENVLALRFTRPFSERLNINVFSNYRHFDAGFFDHNGNDVYGLYQNLTPDTATIVNGGYNPLTNEYMGGLRLQWTGLNGGTMHLGAKYTDCVNELALDKPVTSEATLVRERLNQYRTLLDFGSMGRRLGPAVLDFQARFESNALVRLIPVTGGTARDDGSNRELSCAVRVNVPFTGAASSALTYRLRQIDRHPFDRGEATALEQTPEVSFCLSRGFGRLHTSATASAGYSLYRLDRTSGSALSWSAEAGAEYGGQKARAAARAYAKQSALPYDIPYYYTPYDSAMGLAAPLLDRYLITGGEVSLRRGGAGIMLGCQSILGVEPVTVRHAWPEAAVPYEQPRIVFLASPELGPWRGFTLSSRALISDSRPFLKCQSVLSCTAHPSGTREYIDLRFGFDYWGERGPVEFANLYDWGRPIYNANFELAVHIISFRFFGRIDNLLDRKNAYVPGYFSPGLTFRWGFCWFLQR
jgi:hypothetical protein